MYHGGEKQKRGSASVSAIGVILRSESFYVKQVLQQVKGHIIKDRKGGATVPWHHFDGGVSAASCQQLHGTYTLLVCWQCVCVYVYLDMYDCGN